MTRRTNLRAGRPPEPPIGWISQGTENRASSSPARRSAISPESTSASITSRLDRTWRVPANLSRADTSALLVSEFPTGPLTSSDLTCAVSDTPCSFVLGSSTRPSSHRVGERRGQQCGVVDRPHRPILGGLRYLRGHHAGPQSRRGPFEMLAFGGAQRHPRVHEQDVDVDLGSVLTQHVEVLL